MILILKCEHGERTVEFEDGREGVGSNQYAQDRVRALLPSCPYCEARYGYRIAMAPA